MCLLRSSRFARDFFDFFQTFATTAVIVGLAILTQSIQTIKAQQEGTNPVDVFSLLVTGSGIFAATDTIVYISTNNGVSWTASSSGLPNVQVNAFTVSGGKIFAGTNGAGVFVSGNNGASWTASNSGITCMNVGCFAVLGNTIFAGVDSVVYKSTNNGASWTVAGSNFGSSEIRCLAIAGSKVIAGSNGNGAFISSDSGKSWTAVNSGLTGAGLSVKVVTVVGNNIFAGTMNGISLSVNYGASWTDVNNGLVNLNESSLVVIGNNLFAGTLGTGVYVSANSGASWAEADTGLTNGNVMCLAVSGNTLFAGTAGDGVFKSTDNGATWKASNTGFTGICRPALKLSNRAPFKIFTPCAGGSNASIEFFLPQRERVNFTIYNFSGHAVESLANKQFDAGIRTLFWNTKSLLPGCYTVRMRTGTNVCAKNFSIVR